jgi:hypothetical protein
MKIHKEIQQGSIEWLELKHAKIGGTLSAGLFVDSDTLYQEILFQSMEDFEYEDGYVSDAMQRGTDLEPFAIQEMEAILNIKFDTFGLLQSDECEILVCSPDGLTSDYKIAIETKCLGRKAHGKIILENEIPKDKIAQLVHYFTVNEKLEKLYFVSYRPENKITPIWYKELKRDSLVSIGVIKSKIKEDRGNGLKDYVCEIPNVKPISEWSKIAVEKALPIEKRVKDKIEELEKSRF